MRTDETMRPVLVTALGVGILSCLDATMKIVSAAYPIGQVVGLRYAAGSLVAIIVFLAFREARPTWASARRNLMRSVVILCTATAFFTAIARLPLAEAVALTFLAPLFMALLGRLILGEPIQPRIFAGIVIGLAGVIVIAHGQATGEARQFDAIGLAAALATAFFYALSMVLMRQQSAKDSTLTIVALSNTFTFLLAAPIAAVQWQPPTLAHLGAFALAGLLGTCGHLCLAWAYSRARAAKLGILEYTAFIWAGLLGFIFFAEVPTAWTVAGAMLIMLACLVSTWTGLRFLRPSKAA